MNDSKALGERTLIVTPTYNERSNITEFVQAVRMAAPAADIMIVDDNSPDGTGEIADELSRNDPQVKVMHRPKKLGLGTAYVQAFRRGLTQDYDRFFEMDADFSHDPAYLPAFLAALDAGADLVLGSRNIPGGRVEGWGAGRHVLSKGGSLYSRLILGIDVSDLTTGYKAFSRRALEAIELDQVHSNGYSFQVEMTYRALRKDLKIAEVPIIFVDRRVGQSKMDRKIFVEAVSVVWRLRFDALRGRV